VDLLFIVHFFTCAALGLGMNIVITEQQQLTRYDHGNKPWLISYFFNGTYGNETLLYMHFFLN